MTSWNSIAASCKRVVSLRDRVALHTIIALIVLAVVLPVRGFAQRLDGTLHVAVTDTTGAVVPEATVEATNENTKVVTDATSNGDIYVFPSLLPGMYTIDVEKAGFNKFERQHVNVLPNQVTDATAPLQVGSQATTVTVEEEGETQIKTTSSDLSSGFSGGLVQQLPTGNTIGGDVKEFAVLLPNTTTQPGGVAGSGGSTGGLRPRFNSFTIDGSDDNSVVVNGPLTPVIQDAVQDFTLLTNQFSAEYGHSAASIYAITTKSGTNDFHGEVHEYNRSRNYDAFDNQEKLNGSKNRFDYNRVGASLGGPILKNRLFFFGAFEYQDENEASTGNTVASPTAAGLATLKSMAHDPAVVDILNQIPAAATADTTIPVAVRTVNGVVIPVGFLAAVGPSFTREHDFQVNMDWNRGRNAVHGRFLYDRQRAPDLQAAEPVTQFNGTNDQDNRKFVLSDVFTVSPSLLNEFRFSFTHAAGPSLVTPAALANFPTLEIDSLSDTLGPDVNAPQISIVNTYQWVDNVTKVIGTHTLKFGAEVRNNISPNNTLPRARGEWDYADLSTLVNDYIPNGLNGALRGAGSGFFAGNFRSYYAFVQDDWKIMPRLTLNLGLRYEYNGAPRDAGLQTLNAIANDPRLGLIFGTQQADTNNWGPRAGFAFDPTGRGTWAIRGGFGVFYDITALNFDQNLLPPELQSEQNPILTCGVAARPAWCSMIANPTPAPGSAYTGFLQGGGLATVNVPPATQAAARAATQGIMLNIVEPKIFGWSLSLQHQLSRSTSVEVRYVGNHAMELPAQIRLNSASAFDSSVVINGTTVPLPGGGLKPLPTYIAAASVPAAVPAPASTLAAFNSFLAAGTFQPLSVDGFTGSFTIDPAVASSIYHGGSVEVKHRMGHGLFVDADYTLAHVDDDATNEFNTSHVNPRRSQDGLSDLRLTEWGRSALDIRNKFAMSVVYDLPTYKKGNGLVRGFANGWEVIATYLAQSGQPVTALSGSDSNANGDSAGDRAILNPSGVANTGSGVNFVCNDGAGGATRIATSTSASSPGFCATAHVVGYVAQNPNAEFVQAGVGAMSNLGRNTINSPGLNIWNMSFSKVTTISERMSVEFRVETYDTFNHRNPSIGLPTNNGSIDQNTNPNPQSVGYPVVTSASFLSSATFNGGSRKIQLGAKFRF